MKMKTLEGVSAEKLNEAYEALEKMRKLNVEVMCSDRGIPVNQHTHEQCTCCVLETVPVSRPVNFPRIRKLAEDIANDSQKNNRFPRIRKLVKDSKKSPPCLVCSSPACRKHSSASFRNDNITICLSCEEILSLDFVIDVLTSSTEEQRISKIDRIIDAYDRTLILLHYSKQFMLDLATKLEEKTVRQNHVGLGSSATGIVSGALGVAAAATILTPAGPPLLVASLIFGGSATAVQTGSETINYFSEPNQLANRILALQGVLIEVLNVVGVLRDALLQDHVRSDHYTNNESNSKFWEEWPKDKLLKKSLTTVGTYGLAGAEVSQAVRGTVTLGGRNARFFSRTGSNIMRTARFARFAGGALSAAVLVLEARSLNNTIADIRSGNPCEKAERIREIHDRIGDLPDTITLDVECRRYLGAMNLRHRTMTEQEVARILVEQSEAASSDVQEKTNTAEPKENSQGISILEGGEASDAAPASQSSLSMSLLERIELHKKQESFLATSQQSGSRENET